MGFKTDLAAEKASARVRLEQFKQKAGIVFDTEALISEIEGHLERGGMDWVYVELEIAFDPIHTVHVKTGREDQGDYVKVNGKVLEISYYNENSDEFLGCFCNFLRSNQSEIKAAIAKIKALTPAPTPPAPTETPAARYAKALRELADKIEKGEI